MADPVSGAITGASVGAALVNAAVSATVSVGLSLAASAIFAQTNAQSPVRYAPNEVSRGGFLPTVMGRRVIGCNIGWVGDRHSQAADHGGGSELTPKPGGSNIYMEGGWHQLCHGPVRRLYRIWAANQCIFSEMLDSSVVPSGSTYQLASAPGAARISDYFSIWFGQDDQPVSTYLQSQTTLVSNFPGLCYIIWHRKNLGSSPVWPLMRYEIET